MTDANPAKFKKLVTLLKELFQLDQPDLDFGIYRIMHAKADEVTKFLSSDLLPQVKEAFASYQPADKAALQAELTKALDQAQALGADPETLPKVKELRARIANESVDIGALENEAYDHLYSFFRRYYSEGDFLAKRVYKPGVYAIPYEGEEVALHWANKDQYYIKTNEYLRDYAFRLKPEADEAKGEDPMRVHLRLVDAAEDEHGNAKAVEGKDRAFILAAEDFITLKGGELSLNFEYRPATLADGPAAADGDDEEDASGAEGKTKKKKPPTQKVLLALAVERIMAVDEPALAEWLAELRKAHVRADGEQAEYSRLVAHLQRYTARNTFDYFIHKDLGGFLSRELDFYIKNEVMHLDDVESETTLKVEQYLSKIKVVRKIAGKIIAFLAQLENFQKKLWLKKKFVIETSWCIALDQIPESFHDEVVVNDAQIGEWIGLCAIDELDDYSTPLTGDFLKANATLMVDTRHFGSDFTERLLGEITNAEGRGSGVLVHGDNFQALSLLGARYHGQAKCIYIDPPYNTGSDGFVYKDNYQHSSWASMILDRVNKGRPFLRKDGAVFASIDEGEQPNLRLLMNAAMGADNFVADLVWAAGRKNDSRLVSVSHEYIVTYARDRAHLAESKVEWRQRKKGLDDIYAQHARLKREHRDDYAAMTAGMKTWYRDLPDADPAKAHKHYAHVDFRGIYFPDNISWPGGGGPKYEVLHPVTGKPVKVPSRGWMTSDPEKMKQWIVEERVHFGDDESAVPCIKSYLKDREYQAPYSVFYQDGRAATKRLRHVLGTDDFGFPKDETVIAELIEMLNDRELLAIDYFAGSGTTAHSVINLNRADGGGRRFVLVEMGDHFNMVLLPRLKKITFSPEWKDGKPQRLATSDEASRGPRVFKVIRLESYEDSINNLRLDRREPQQLALAAAQAQGADKLKEQYLLRYQLEVEARGSQSLLNVSAFTDPTAYKLLVKQPGSDESREIRVDLIETFNYLIGLAVEHMAAPRNFAIEFERDSEGRLQLKSRLKQDASGPWWFRAVTGTTPEDRKTLIIWRKLTGDMEQDNLVLNEWFTKQGYSTKDSEFELIYVNGDNTLENLKAADDTWKVRLIEEDFHRLMFEGTES